MKPVLKYVGDIEVEIAAGQRDILIYRRLPWLFGFAGLVVFSLDAFLPVDTIAHLQLASLLLLGYVSYHSIRYRLFRRIGNFIHRLTTLDVSKTFGDDPNILAAFIDVNGTIAVHVLDPSLDIPEIVGKYPTVKHPVGGLQETLNAIENAAKLKTQDEAVQEFLVYMWELVDYWHNNDRAQGREKLSGLLHSILVTLDGDAMTMPPYKIIPMHEDAEGWVTTEDSPDIAGSLHDRLYEFGPERSSKAHAKNHPENS